MIDPFTLGWTKDSNHYTFWLIIIKIHMLIVQIMKNNTLMDEQTWHQLKYPWNFYFLNKLIAPNAKFSKFWTSIIESGGNLKLEPQHCIQHANHKLWMEVGGVAIDVFKTKTHNFSFNTLMCLYGACLWWLLEMVTRSIKKDTTTLACICVLEIVLLKIFARKIYIVTWKFWKIIY